jgi:uncharacterized protein YdhG (YjbR/CyaY superfamily)
MADPKDPPSTPPQEVSMSPTTATPKTTKRSTARSKRPDGFTAQERAAMRERVREMKGQDGEADLLAKVAEMGESDRVMAERLHALVKDSAPELSSRTWYGMPAYAKDGSVVLFFKPAEKFKARYATLGFSDKAKLDGGAMWPTEFALTRLTDAEEKTIRALIKLAIS